MHSLCECVRARILGWMSVFARKYLINCLVLFDCQCLEGENQSVNCIESECNEIEFFVHFEFFFFIVEKVVKELNFFLKYLWKGISICGTTRMVLIDAYMYYITKNIYIHTLNFTILPYILTVIYACIHTIRTVSQQDETHYI